MLVQVCCVLVLALAHANTTHACASLLCVLVFALAQAYATEVRSIDAVRAFGLAYSMSARLPEKP